MNNNGGTIRHSGVVDTIDGDCVRVRIQQHAACAGCGMSSHCNATECKEKVIEVWGVKDAYRPGDNVFVTVTTTMAAQALLYGFGLPLVVLMCVLIGVLAITADEAKAALWGLVALVPYYAVLYLFRGNMRRRMTFGIEMAGPDAAESLHTTTEVITNKYI